jgi:type II secretory pathway pseudopilin PulG
MGLEVGAVAAIVGAVVAAGSGSYAAYVSNDNAIDAKKAANAAAEREQEAAAKDAQTILDRADRLKGMQRAALSASGTTLGSGTSGTILGETTRLSEQDALQAIKEGNQRADIIRQQGQLTAGTYQSQGVASALGGVSGMMGGITSYQKATEGTRTATAMNTNTTTQLATRKTPTYSLLGGTSP